MKQDFVELENKYLNEKDKDLQFNLLKELSNPFKHNNNAKALEYAKKAIASNHKYQDVCTFRIFEIYGLVALSKTEEGIEKCNSLLEELNPDDYINQTMVLDYLMVNYIKQGLANKVLDLEKKWDWMISDPKKFSQYTPYVRMNCGIANHSLGKIDLCIEYFSKTYEDFKKLDYTAGIKQILYNLGKIYTVNEDNEKALSFLLESLTYHDEQTPSLDLSRLYEAIGLNYGALNNHDESMSYFNKALNLLGEDQYKYRKLHILSNYSHSLLKHENLEAFFEIETEILKEAEILTNETVLSVSFYISASSAYLLKPDIKAALDRINKAEEILKSMVNIELSLRCTLQKIAVLRALSRFEEALIYYDSYLKMYSEQLSTAKQNALKEFEVKYETAQKEKEKESFKAESLKFQLQSLRSQMNPHFVFNAISSIAGDMHPENLDNSKALLKSFARLMRANLDFAEQDKIKLEQELEFLQDYLKLEQTRIGLNRLNFDIAYKPDLDIEFIEIPSMLLQPYIENAIKHGIAPLKEIGKIKVNFEEQDDHLICIIEDNGVGRKQAAINQKNQQKHQGKSTAISASRLQLLDKENQQKVKVVFADLENANGTPSGTRVTVHIKL